MNHKMPLNTDLRQWYFSLVPAEKRQKKSRILVLTGWTETQWKDRLSFRASLKLAEARCIVNDLQIDTSKHFTSISE